MAFEPTGERMTKAHSKVDLMIVDVRKEMVEKVRSQYPFKKDRKTELYKNFYM